MNNDDMCGNWFKFLAQNLARIRRLLKTSLNLQITATMALWSGPSNPLGQPAFTSLKSRTKRERRQKFHIQIVADVPFRVAKMLPTKPLGFNDVADVADFQAIILRNQSLANCYPYRIARLRKCSGL